MKELYCEPFVFKATYYEEYQDGQCIGKGEIAVKVISKTVDNRTAFPYKFAMFHLEGELPMSIKRNFGIPVFGEEHGDILDDRIQYGRIPDNMSWNDSSDPVVCNIFDNRNCIRFAMMSPLRIVEFTGVFELIGE